MQFGDVRTSEKCWILLIQSLNCSIWRIKLLISPKSCAHRGYFFQAVGLLSELQEPFGLLQGVFFSGALPFGLRKHPHRGYFFPACTPIGGIFFGRNRRFYAPVCVSCAYDVLAHNALVRRAYVAHPIPTYAQPTAGLRIRSCCAMLDVAYVAQDSPRGLSCAYIRMYVRCTYVDGCTQMGVLRTHTTHPIRTHPSRGVCCGWCVRSTYVDGCTFIVLE